MPVTVTSLPKFTVAVTVSPTLSQRSTKPVAAVSEALSMAGRAVSTVTETVLL